MEVSEITQGNLVFDPETFAVNCEFAFTQSVFCPDNIAGSKLT